MMNLIFKDDVRVNKQISKSPVVYVRRGSAPNDVTPPYLIKQGEM